MKVYTLSHYCNGEGTNLLKIYRNAPELKDLLSYRDIYSEECLPLKVVQTLLEKGTTGGEEGYEIEEIEVEEN